MFFRKGWPACRACQDGGDAPAIRGEVSAFIRLSVAINPDVEQHEHGYADGREL